MYFHFSSHSIICYLLIHFLRDGNSSHAMISIHWSAARATRDFFSFFSYCNLLIELQGIIYAWPNIFKWWNFFKSPKFFKVKQKWLESHFCWHTPKFQLWKKISLMNIFLFDAFVQISHTVPRSFCLIQCLHFKEPIWKNKSNEILNIQYDIRVVDVLYIAWKAEAWIIELKEITNELPTLRMSRIKYFKLVFRR